VEKFSSSSSLSVAFIHHHRALINVLTTLLIFHFIRKSVSSFVPAPFPPPTPAVWSSFLRSIYRLDENRSAEHDGKKQSFIEFSCLFSFSLTVFSLSNFLSQQRSIRRHPVPNFYFHNNSIARRRGKQTNFIFSRQKQSDENVRRANSVTPGEVAAGML
jgi:hypothetical protein